MSRQILQKTSPNFNERDLNIPLKYIVLHYTGMKTATEALARLCDPEAKVSAHYVVDTDGRITQLVDESRRAWHAGESFWRGITDMNSASIGVEIVNPGHEFGYTPFPPAQIEAVYDLTRFIIKRRKMQPLWAPVGHAEIAPQRKQDPGELFPWKQLAAGGLGFWPTPTSDDEKILPVHEAQKLLRHIGFECSANGVHNQATREVVKAFQRRYRPERVNGELDKKTCAMLKALAQAVTPQA